MSRAFTGARVMATLAATSLLLLGCSMPPSQAEHGDMVLNAHDAPQAPQRDVVLGGYDKQLGGQDTTLSTSDGILNRGGAQYHPQKDHVLNDKPVRERPEADTPKRSVSVPELAAITVAVSKSAEDPNAVSIVRARIDATSNPVRPFCARLNDSRLDDANNRFNVVFGIVEQGSGQRAVVAIVDAGERAAVACRSLGYLSD